eukprot:COSAG02_NODE_2644_length_8343_cov_16.256308_5_plen_81_part_00
MIIHSVFDPIIVIMRDATAAQQVLRRPCARGVQLVLVELLWGSRARRWVLTWHTGNRSREKEGAPLPLPYSPPQIQSIFF